MLFLGSRQPERSVSTTVQKQNISLHIFFPIAPIFLFSFFIFSVILSFHSPYATKPQVIVLSVPTPSFIREPGAASATWWREREWGPEVGGWEGVAGKVEGCGHSSELKCQLGYHGNSDT